MNNNGTKNESAAAPWNRVEALLSTIHFMSAWEEWLKGWGGSVQAVLEPGSEDYPPYTCRMINGALANAHFGCRFQMWPTGRLGTGYTDARLTVVSDTDDNVVTFAYEGATNSWTKTGSGLRGFPCAWPEDPHPQFPLQTIRTWMNILAHQMFCCCGSLLAKNETGGFTCPNPSALVHTVRPTSPTATATDCQLPT